MGPFRLVVLDYAKDQLNSPAACKALSDMVITKQMNFERTDPNYIVTDKHDMIGTHLLIYDTSVLFSPKLIFALRMTYEDRSLQHKIKTPIQDLIPKLDEASQKAYAIFKSRFPVLVDCNAWFVDPQYSQKNSGLRLSDIGYTMAYLHLVRMGYTHMIGCTNERYKASRWLENIGFFQKGFEFIHPVVPDPHMFIMIEQFNHEYLKSVYNDYADLFDHLQELIPPSLSYPSIASTTDRLYKKSAKIYQLERKKAG